MRSAELSAAVRPTERLLQVLRLVYVGAIPLYAIVLLATSGGWPAPGNAWFPYSPMTLPLTLGAAITLISSRSVRRSMLSDGALERMLSTEASSSVPGLTPEEQKLATLAPKLVAPFVVSLRSTKLSRCTVWCLVSSRILWRCSCRSASWRSDFSYRCQ